MFERDYTPQSFVSQLFEVAPAIATLLKSYTARIRASVSSHDGVNGYGWGLTFHVFIEVHGERCKNCFEDSYSPPRFDCRWHRFERLWISVADGEGKDLAAALARLDDPVNLWMQKAERRAA